MKLNTTKKIFTNLYFLTSQQDVKECFLKFKKKKKLN